MCCVCVVWQNAKQGRRARQEVEADADEEEAMPANDITPDVVGVSIAVMFASQHAGTYHP